jgi:ABC-type bacteriocin/lantibiotic exporter with double-glycine peptidase domain
MLGVEEDAPRLTSMLAALVTSPELSWTTRLSQAVSSLGLSSSVYPASSREICRLASSESIWATCTKADDGSERWTLVFEVRSGRASVYTQFGERWFERRLSESQLAKELGVSPEAPIQWVGVEVALPMESLRSQGGGHGGTVNPLARARAMLRLERDAVGILVVYAVLVGLLTLASPLTVQVLVNTVAFGTVIQPLLVLALALFGVLALAGGLRILEHYVAELLQQRIFVRAVADLAHRLPRVDASVSTKYYAPELVNRFFEVVSLQKSAANLLLDGMEVFLQAILGMTVLAFYHPLLLAFDALIITSLLAVVFLFGRGAIASSIAESDAKYAVVAWLEEVALNPTTLRSRAGARLASERANGLAREYLTRRRKHFRILFRQIIGVVSTQVMASALLLGLGGWLVISGELTLGQLVAAELIVTAVVTSIAKFGKHFESFYDMVTSLSKLGKLVDLPMEPPQGELPPTSNIPARVGISGLSVGGVKGQDMLYGVDLEVAPGEHTALTGPPCSGKSALLEALYRMRAPSKGRLEFDGADVRTLSIQALRDQMGFVRDAEVVDGTLEENVRLAHPGLPATEVVRALTAVGLQQELGRFPDGAATQITSGGAPLSDSQKLRLTIARAIAFRPRLLLIDGTLDRLEPGVRASVLRNLTAPGVPWTLVISTHAPDVMELCQRTVRMIGGAVAAAEKK